MTQPEDIEDRIAKLEQDVAHLRRELARTSSNSDDARTLAAGADRDVSLVSQQLRAQLSLLNALRETQSGHTHTLLNHTRVLDDHTRVLDDHTRVLDDHTRVLDDHGRQLTELRTEMRDGFARVDKGFAQADANFARIESQFAGVHAGMSHIVDLLTPGDPA